MASEWQEDELQAMITELPQQRLVLPSGGYSHMRLFIISQMLEVLLELYRKLMVLGIFKIYNYFMSKCFYD